MIGVKSAWQTATRFVIGQSAPPDDVEAERLLSWIFESKKLEALVAELKGRVEGVAGVNLPMLVRAFTYRNRDLETMVKRAVSGGCEGVLHMNVDPVYAATRS